MNYLTQPDETKENFYISVRMIISEIFSQWDVFFKLNDDLGKPASVRDIANYNQEKIMELVLSFYDKLIDIDKEYKCTPVLDFIFQECNKRIPIIAEVYFKKHLQ